MTALFLQETEATVVVFDLRGYSRLAVSLPPLDLGLALGHYYSHAEACVLPHHGRLVKLAGDAVLVAWLANEEPKHKQRALAAIDGALAQKQDWLAQNESQGLPHLDYSIAAATGPVLAGHIGTDRFRSFDVLGDPVNVAVKLTTVATARTADHVLAFQEPSRPTVELESIDIGGKLVRLFRLERS
jgi:adenylate cyclase